MLRKMFMACRMIFDNPELFLKYFIGRINRIACWVVKSLGKTKYFNGVKFIIDKDYEGFESSLKEIRSNSFEIDVVETIKSKLKKGDVYFDVGANVGYMTAIGAGLVGKEGSVHSFEPVPYTYEKLRRVADLNPQYKIFTNNVAVGASNGSLNMHCALPPHTGGSTLLDESLNEFSKYSKIKVPVVTLSEYAKDKKISNISLIKIDVEGFEFQVIKGLSDYFNHTKIYPTILTEVIAASYEVNDLLSFMSRYNYSFHDACFPKKVLKVENIKRGMNILFVQKD